MAMDLRRIVATGFAILGTFSVAASARAQLSADPYKPYNAEYEAYTYPSYPTGVGVLPNQPVLEGMGGSGRSYQRFLEEEDEAERAPAGSSGAGSYTRRGVGVPYYRAYRQSDVAMNRVYSPNKKVDEDYLANRRGRDEAYGKYLGATDPKKKAQYLKEYQQYDQRVRRDLNGSPASTPSRASARNDGKIPPRPPIPGTEGSGPRRPREPGAATGARRNSGSSRPSDVMRRSESMENSSSTRPRPTTPSPSLPSRRPAADTTP